MVLTITIVWLHDFNTWEGGITLAVVGIVECERCAQCVGDIIAETAVELASERIHVIHLLPVAAVEHHRIDAHSSVAHTHSGTRIAIVLLTVGLVIAQCQLMVF